MNRIFQLGRSAFTAKSKRRIATIGSIARKSLICTLAVLGAAVSAGPRTPEGETTLRQLVDAASLSDLRWPRFPEYRAEVAEFYDSVGYARVWIRRGTVTAQADQLIKELQNADARGLAPEDYDASRWAARLDRLQSADAQTSQVTARFDLALTVSAMRYVAALHTGRINPKLCHFAFDAEGKRLDLATFLRERVVNAVSVSHALHSVEPRFPGYQRLLIALQKYRALAREDDGELLPAAGTIEPGESFKGRARLVRLLRLLGDLPADVPVEANSEIYGGVLVDAIRRFQSRHGIDPDGRIGTTTLEQLNTPLSHRVRQLELTLERWRWAPHEFAVPPIVVNIPEFRLRAYDRAYRSELQMKVVVGRAYKHRTPVFANDLRYVIFRPYWNVPRSIERAEITPKIERNRSYAARNGYEIVDARGEVVPGDFVSDQTLRQLRSGKLGIRQVPGIKNALGLVKFLFPNDYHVYMHDTPAVELFSKARRDFSHGCIRVEKPEELAAWVLKNNPEWTRERIHEAMYGNKTIQVNLKNPIPVLIVYGTAVAPETGEVRFLRDIYGYDVMLENLLAKGYPYTD